jgi:hypothetical protein
MNSRIAMRGVHGKRERADAEYEESERRRAFAVTSIAGRYINERNNHQNIVTTAAQLIGLPK